MRGGLQPIAGGRHLPSPPEAFTICKFLRIGGASALFNQGVSPEFIKAIGRWWSGAYLLYIRAMQGNAQKLMVKACSQACEYLEGTPDDNNEDDEL